MTSEANKEALKRAAAVQPMLIGVKRAGGLAPHLSPRDLLHAGPPLAGWEEACGALQGATVGRLVRDGWATGAAAAERVVASGEFVLKPANDHGMLGTFAGLISPKTPVLVVKDKQTGLTGAAAINEGRGKAVRYGSTDDETLARLAWIESEFAETLGRAIELAGGVDVGAIMEQALHMGDDGHSRQKAASSVFTNMIAAPLVDAGFHARATARALRFLAANEIFFLPIAIAAAKVAMRAAQGVPGSTVVTCMAANGVRFGIQVSGLAGQWFTAPVPPMHGRLFSGFDEADAGPLIGDSLVSETMGLGAFAMAAAPALAPYVGGSPDEATRLALEMYHITLSEHPRYKIPALSYRGTPFGIDAARVAQTKTMPLFNAGIAHRRAGVGQIGAGFGRAPLACFQRALEAM